MPAGFDVQRRQASHGFRRSTLRFEDAGLEGAFRTVHFRQNLSHVRWAYVLGITLWAALGVLAQVVLAFDRDIDAFIRFGIAIPATAVGLALSFTGWFEHRWEAITSVAILVSALAVVTDWALIEDVPPTWGFTGLMVILAFNYAFVRIRFVYATVAGFIAVGYYNVVAVIERVEGPDLVYADFFLGSIVVMGMSVSYLVERSSRLLFLRDLELADEKERSEALLRNTLPDAIVERLKEEHRTIADACPEVTVLFADMESFTQHAERMAPDDLVHALDEIFRRFDALADRFGLEKIKTVGDAYMAVSGAPEPREDHAEAAAEMALAIVETLEGVTWPTGGSMRARLGMASGPVVAGVIGERKFAYDLWGDTVNLASRLESHGVPGKIQVSAATHERLRERYTFEPPHVVELKGKGPTEAYLLVGRRRPSGKPQASAGVVEGGTPVSRREP